MLLREDCDVLKIDFPFHSDLDGALSPALCEFPKLWSLDLMGTKVSGDLAMLARCTGLQTLDLSKTNVAGDVKALENVVELETLKLADTKVEGNIEALHGLTSLRELFLSDTKVEGDIEALHTLTELRHLRLENTNVSGYVASLREARGLLDHNVEISGTRIAGARCLSAWGLLPEALSPLGRCLFIKSGGSATRGCLSVLLAKAGALLYGIPLPTFSPVVV